MQNTVVFGFYYKQICQNREVYIGRTNNMARRIKQWQSADGMTPHIVFACTSKEPEQLQCLVQQYFNKQHLGYRYVKNPISKKVNKRIKWFKTEVQYDKISLVVSMIEFYRQNMKEQDVLPKVRSILKDLDLQIQQNKKQEETTLNQIDEGPLVIEILEN